MYDNHHNLGDYEDNMMALARSDWGESAGDYEEDNMARRMAQITIATSKKALLEAQAARVLDQLNKLEERPDEPEFTDDPDNPQVIWFRRSFQSGTAKYTYAAVKACGYWYVSGRVESMQRRTWDQLMDWLFASYENGVSDYRPEIWLADEWVLVK
jgi:hypothetical protein